MGFQPLALRRSAKLGPARYPFGMWVWILHRVSGLALALYLLIHIAVISSSRGGESGFDRMLARFHSPVGIALDLLLLWAVVFHTANGVRVLLFDLGIGVRAQKRVFWGVMAGGVILYLAALAVLVPFVVGKPLPK